MRSTFYTYLPQYRAIIKLGVPIIMGQIAMVLLSICDTLMVGHYNTDSLAASAFTGSLFYMPLMFCMGISLGFIPIAGACFGRNDKFEVGNLLRHAHVVNLIALIVLMIPMTILYFCLDYLGQPAELLPLVKPYYLCFLLSFPFISLYFTYKQFTDSITETKISMKIIVLGVVMNIVLNYLLIYGIYPFPELGLLGAGIATVIARVFMAVSYLFYIQFNHKYAIYQKGFRHGGFEFSKVRTMWKMGFPIAMQLLLEASSFSLTSIMAGWIGTIALAAHQIMLTFSQFFFMVYNGLGSALSVRISIFNGQKNLKGVKHTTNAGIQLMMGLFLFNAIVAFSTRNYIGVWFTENDAVAMLIPMVMIPLIMYQAGDALQITYINVLRGLGDVKPIMWISMVCYLGISLPISYICGITFHWGLTGVWMGFPFSLSLAGIGYYLCYRQNLKKKDRWLDEKQM
ncbi:MAG: MATE family efflux transporter [Bacteroidaceae bacterium]